MYDPLGENGPETTFWVLVFAHYFLSRMTHQLAALIGGLMLHNKEDIQTLRGKIEPVRATNDVAQRKRNTSRLGGPKKENFSVKGLCQGP